MRASTTSQQVSSVPAALSSEAVQLHTAPRASHPHVRPRHTVSLAADAVCCPGARFLYSSGGAWDLFRCANVICHELAHQWYEQQLSMQRPHWRQLAL